MKKAAIIDYGAGNLKNVKTALDDIGLESVITSKKEDLDAADALILPGVGAFPDAMKSLEETGLIETIKENVARGKVLLGICLGMQMLFDSSDELEKTAGLGFIPGTVQALSEEELRPGSKIPHMGWNELIINREDPFIEDINEGDYVYFVHSYYAVPENFEEDVVTWADYTVKVPAVVRRGNVIGTQFHPEKSSQIGKLMLENLKKIVEDDSITSN